MYHFLLYNGHCFALSPFLFVHLLTSFTDRDFWKNYFIKLWQKCITAQAQTVYAGEKLSSRSHRFLASYSNLILKSLLNLFCYEKPKHW